MLMSMRSRIEAMRALAYVVAAAQDNAHHNPDENARKQGQAFADLMIPVVKGWSTESAIDIASLGVQVHGGMGFIEETGAAQFLRDARITAIYEGTNGIQAMDLVGRKLMDNGDAAFRLIGEIETAAAAARAILPDLANDLWQAAESLREATEAMLAQELNDRFAGAVPYLRAFALVLGSAFHLKAAQADPARLALARVMIRRLLPEHAALLARARPSAADLYALSAEALAG